MDGKSRVNCFDNQGANNNNNNRLKKNTFRYPSIGNDTTLSHRFVPIRKRDRL